MASRVKKTVERNRSYRTDHKTSSRMKAVGQHSTAPEMAVRDAVAVGGYAFTTNAVGLPGRPDLASPDGRWAIFVHGCFWHVHAGCSLATTPIRNHQLWNEKFKATKTRDAKNQQALHDLGIPTLVVWECQTHDSVQLRALLQAFFSSLATPSSLSLSALSKATPGRVAE